MKCGDCTWYEDGFCDNYGKLVYDWYECNDVKPRPCENKVGVCSLERDLENYTPPCPQKK